jgi:hypothetical protein
MAAGVVSRTITRGKDVWGHTAVMPFSYYGPTSYVAGGEAIAANAFKLGVIEEIPAFLGVNAAGTLAVVYQYNYATGKMQAFYQNEAAASALVEVAAATDLSLYTGRGRAYGKG